MIRARLGAIMTNPLRIPNVTCDVCTGPISQDYRRCYRCSMDARQRAAPVAHRVVPLTYAVAGTQADRDMYRYKEPIPAANRLRNSSYQRLLLLLMGFADVHARCLDIGASKPATGMAVVPSLRGRAGAHPLVTLAAVLPSRWEEIKLEAAHDVPEAQRRTLRSDHFFVPEPAAVTNRHLVLLEDTWVQGGHAQSAAAALLLAGAAEVTIVVVARRIRTDYQPANAEAALQRILAEREYSVEICPLTGANCHRTDPEPGF